MSAQHPAPQAVAFAKLKDALRTPIHQARREQYKNLHQLQNLRRKVLTALQELRSLPNDFTETLLAQASQFDDAQPSQKPQALERFIDLLRNDPDWLASAAPDQEQVAAMTPWRAWSSKKISTLKGVGLTTEKKLAENGFHVLADLLLYFPRTHVFWRKTEGFSGLQAGDHIVTYGTVTKSAVRFGRGRRFEVVLQDEAGQKLTLIFFQFQK